MNLYNSRNKIIGLFENKAISSPMHAYVAKSDDKKLASKNNAPFTSCILKINNTLTDNAEGLDIVMPMYNLI